MRALTWQGTRRIELETVLDPFIEHPRDAIVKITATAICGSDLHIYNGYIPAMEKGDILGHEFMGEVVEVGSEVSRLKVGDRVVVPFVIACGGCFFCQKELWALCDRSNPSPEASAKLTGYPTAGLFGYSHLFGGYQGGQAEFARVPFADVGPVKAPEHFTDEQALFLSDILPTGWMAAENAQIEPGSTVAVWGCGPVGQMAMQCAWVQGAGRVIAIDEHPRRLELAAKWGHAETINFREHDEILGTLKEMTDGRGPDSCIDAVGMEAHGVGTLSRYEKAKQQFGIIKDSPYVLRQAIMACRKGGTISIPGVYMGQVEHIPFGAAFAKGLTLKMGQTHVHRYLGRLLKLIDQGKLDPTVIISHRLSLSEGPAAYQLFNEERNLVTKIVLRP